MGSRIVGGLERLADSKTAKLILAVFALGVLVFGVATFLRTQEQAQSTALPVAQLCQQGQAPRVEAIRPGACGAAEQVVSNGPGQITVAGPDGKDGQVGAQGATGSPGRPGAVGVGAPGTPGTAGTAGLDGATGQPGARGLPGAVGSNGSNGQEGAQGPPGTNGSNGQDGITGPPGPTGPAGPAGPAGPQGDPGAPGAPGTTTSCPGGTSLQPVTFADGKSGMGCVSSSSPSQAPTN